ncbi:MAG: radical SAM protein, partial [Rhodospirillales bacterium]|nr:radical SAM protein [Rhodospirillales bacterium]
MKVTLIHVGSTISNFGFRVIGAVIRRRFPDTALHFVMGGNIRSLANIIMANSGSGLADKDIGRVAKALAAHEVIGFACMTEHAGTVKRLIAELRRLRPDAYILWGGIHAMLHPEDAIGHADAVCTSEGEKAAPQLLARLEDGEDPTVVENFWFRRGDGEIIRNEFQTLLSTQEMEALPHPVYRENELIYDPAQGFRPTRTGDYLNSEALSYVTIWSRGCPFRCSFCANSRLLEMDRDYGRVRHASVDHLIEEVRRAVDRSAHISSVTFQDDCFISLPEDVLREFADKWRRRIGLPFSIQGLTPAHTRREKLAILMGGGLNRVRLGVQSGSDRILKFYKRPNRAGLVREAVEAVGSFAKQMVPPAYDIILDNPIETADDVKDTLRLIQDMPRPFTLNVFSLRHIPNTELGRQLARLEVELEGIDRNYSKVRPTYANALFYLVAFIRLPAPLFDFALRFAKPYRQSSQRFGFLVWMFRTLFFVRRAM